MITMQRLTILLWNMLMYIQLSLFEKVNDDPSLWVRIPEPNRDEIEQHFVKLIVTIILNRREERKSHE